MSDITFHNDCHLCRLGKATPWPGVGGNGPEDASILVVGDTPLEGSTTAFEPQSVAGAYLRNICDGITNQSEGKITFRFTHAVRCSKIDNKATTAKEIESCRNWLQHEIKIVNPQVIILVGATALASVFGATRKLGTSRGKVINHGDRKYVPMYHPSLAVKSTAKYGTGITQEEYQKFLVDDLITAANAVMGIEAKEKTVEYHVVKSKVEAFQILQDTRNAPLRAKDIEANTWSDSKNDTIFKPGLEILCLGMTWEDDKSVVFPLQSKDSFCKDDLIWQRQFLKSLWSLPGLDLWQNGVYDQLALHLAYDLPFFRTYHDLILVHHLLWSHKRHALSVLATEYTSYGGYEAGIMAAVKELDKDIRGYHNLDPDIVYHKNAYDTACTFSIFNQLWPKIKEDPQLLWIYDNISIPITNPLSQMSLRGINLNVPRCQEAQVTGRIIINQIEDLMRRESQSWRNAEELLGQRISVNNDLHRQTLLFTKECEGLTPTKISKKTGVPSTDKEVLAPLAETSDVAYAVMKLRELEVVESKLLVSLPKHIGYDGRIHPQFKVYGTRTGRPSGYEPCLFNLPSHSLDMVEADEDHWLLCADISQAELRMAGIVAREPGLLDAYNSGTGPDGLPIDIHAAVGQRMFNVSYEEVKKDKILRRKVKEINFGQLYQMTKYGLANKMNVPVEEADRLIKIYFKTLPNIKKNLIEPTKKQLLEHGCVRSIFGRYWWCNDTQKVILERLKNLKVTGKLTDKYGKPMNIWDNKDAAEILRQAANSLIQGPSSDMVELGLIKFERQFHEHFNTYVQAKMNKKPAEVYLENEIYDSVIVSVRKDLLIPVATLLKKCLENPEPPFPMPCPWVVDLTYGPTMLKDSDKYPEERRAICQKDLVLD